jgi:hypothetical protein
LLGIEPWPSSLLPFVTQIDRIDIRSTKYSKLALALRQRPFTLPFRQGILFLLKTLLASELGIQVSQLRHRYFRTGTM